MTRAVSAVLLSGLLGASAHGGPTPAPPKAAAVTLLEPGFYWKHQSIPGTQGDWLALVVKDRARLEPVRIQARRDRDFPDAFTLASKEQPEALVFLRGLPPRAYPLAVPMAVPEEPKTTTRGERRRTVFAYASEAWGPIRLVLDLDPGKAGLAPGTAQATLVLHLKDRRQALIQSPLRPDGESLAPMWVGDLDGDQRPDVLLKEEVQGGFQRLRLYLSSAAREDEMVRQVVHLLHGGE